DCTDEREHGGREAPAGHRHERHLADDLRFADRLRPNTRYRGGKLGQETDTKPGGDHHLDPILPLALESDLRRQTLFAQTLGKIVAVLAVDAPEIGLASDIGNSNTVLLLQPVPCRKSNA